MQIKDIQKHFLVVKCKSKDELMDQTLRRLNLKRTGIVKGLDGAV